MPTSEIAGRTYNIQNLDAMRQFTAMSSQGGFSGQVQKSMLSIIFGFLNAKAKPAQYASLASKINAIIKLSAAANVDVFLNLLKSSVSQYPTLPQRPIEPHDPPTRYSEIDLPTSMITRNNLIYEVKDKRHNAQVFGYEIATWRGGKGSATKHGSAASVRTDSQRNKRVTMRKMSDGSEKPNTSYGRNWFSTPSNAAYTYFLWAFEFGWATKDTATRVKRDMDKHLGKGNRSKYKFPVPAYTKLRGDSPVGVMFGSQKRITSPANKNRPSFTRPDYLTSADIGTASNPQFGIMNSLMIAQLRFKNDIEKGIQKELIKMGQADAGQLSRAISAFAQMAPRMTKGEYDFTFRRGGDVSPVAGLLGKDSAFGQYVRTGGPDVVMLTANMPMGATGLNVDVIAYSAANNTPHMYEIKQIYDQSITQPYNLQQGKGWPKVGPGGALPGALTTSQYNAAVTTQHQRFSSIQNHAVNSGYGMPVFEGFFVEGTSKISQQQIGIYTETMSKLK